MTVDATRPKRIPVVHGVEAGTDAHQHQDEDVRKLIETRLNGAPLVFETAMYRYENINDAAQRRLRNVLALFTTAILAQEPVDLGADIVGDVVIASANTVAYDEQPGGIVFRARPTDKKIIGPAEPTLRERICGAILGATQIKDLAEGLVELTVLCVDAPQDDLDRPKPYLKARDQPYGFTVSKREVPNFSDAGNVPARPTCEGP
jgi:hypothetical protein